MPDRTLKDPGRELSEDLARHLANPSRMVWVEVGVGPMWDIRDAGRADVLTMEKSYSRPMVRIYEVKVSRNDFLRDVHAGKYEKYLKRCSQFYFAAPAGMLKREEVPANCGLTVRGDRGWSVAKGATAHQYQPTRELAMGLLMHGYTYWWERWKQREREDLLRFKDFKTLSRDFGIKVATRIQEAEELLNLAEQLKQQIGELMGRDYGSLFNAMYALKSDVNQLLQQRRYAKSAIALAEIVDRLFQGGYYFTDGLADQLRTVADQIQREHEAQKEQETR